MSILWSYHQVAQQDLEDTDVHQNLYSQHELTFSTDLSVVALVFLCV